MRRFWRGFRQARDVRERQERQRAENVLLQKLERLIDDPEMDVNRAEPHVIEAIKVFDPNIGDKELREMVTRFRISFEESREPDQERH